MSDASTTPTTGAPTTTPASPAFVPDEFAVFQTTMAHVLGHPRLREIAAVMMQEGEHDPRQVFVDHGVALPSNATVSFSGAESDSPDFIICVSSPEHTHCMSITLPHIHF
ncbi:hypothetical protein [Aeromicrobium sp.]|uniref:hypothetical protein n=1 Tax=Aeromicrobium sp. TaxID=1871063 RepID=UPI002FC5AA16